MRRTTLVIGLLAGCASDPSGVPAHLALEAGSRFEAAIPPDAARAELAQARRDGGTADKAPGSRTELGAAPLDSGPADADPCLGVTAAGCCKGAVVYFCEKGGLQQLSCAPYGCGWSAKVNLFKCNGKDPPPAGTSASCPAGI